MRELSLALNTRTELDRMGASGAAGACFDSSLSICSSIPRTMREESKWTLKTLASMPLFNLKRRVRLP
jgi:hypothetical protein